MAPATIDEAVVWVDTLQLQETESTIVAEPNLRSLPNGGWLYWDTQLQQARRYGKNGEFLVGVGAPGEGPGEFERLVGFTQIHDGRLLTLDTRGHLARWSEDGQLEQDIATDIVSARGLAAAPGNKVAVILGPQQAGDTVWGSTIQIVDPETGAVERTAARIPLNPRLLTAAYTVQSTGPRARGDTLLVTLLDSGWAIPLDGGEPTSYSLRGPSGDSIRPISAGDAARGEVREWLARTAFVGEFGRLSDGSWVVGTYRILPGQVRHGLRLIDGHGNPVWEIDSSPPLLGVGEADRLYFGDPAGLRPSQILVATLRP